MVESAAGSVVSTQLQSSVRPQEVAPRVERESREPEVKEVPVESTPRTGERGSTVNLKV